jgi:hypothetical protein
MIIFLNFQTFLGIQILQNPNRGPGTPHPKWQNNSCPDDGGWPAKLWISRMFFMVFFGDISGKLFRNYGKSPFFYREMNYFYGHFQ